MKKNVWMYGIIAGIISIAWPVISIGIASGGPEKEKDWDMGMIYGYASMILAFSLIFVAIKKYRDGYNNGVISFGKAFKIGLFITLIASTVYVIVWLIDFFYFIPGFMDQYMQQYTDHMLEKMRSNGATQVEIDKQLAEMAKFSQMYKNPFFNALITYTEILPVGLVISLIASLILKKKSTINPQSVSA